jgi:hypothetical protein
MIRGAKWGMSTYETMSFHLETERLLLRPWADSDAAEFCALLSERSKGTTAVEHIGASIADLLTATAATGIALLPIQCRNEGDFIGCCGLIIARSTVEESETCARRSDRRAPHPSGGPVNGHPHTGRLLAADRLRHQRQGTAFAEEANAGLRLDVPVPCCRAGVQRAPDTVPSQAPGDPGLVVVGAELRQTDRGVAICQAPGSVETELTGFLE